MMVNRPARGLQLRNQKTKHLAQITEPQKALTKGSAGARLKGKGPSVYSQPQWRMLLDQNETRRPPKNFFRPALRPLSQGLDDQPPPSPPICH